MNQGASNMLAIAAVVLVVLSGLASAGTGWDQVSDLRNFNAQEFKQFVSPLLQITANTYRHPRIVPISGWELAPGIEPLNPENGGAHALAYTENSGERLVVGFRGTDLEDSADKCADLLLFHGFIQGMTPPNETTCDQYSSQTLDYYSQAVSFTGKVLQAYPGTPLLLTGHSLGAALAYLVSAYFWSASSLAIPVVSFSTPPMKRVLEEKLVALHNLEVVYSVGDEWDNVMRPLSKQVGVVCLFEKEQPVDCAACRSSPDEASSCLGCFYATHYLKSLMALVEKSKLNPVCVVKSPTSADESTSGYHPSKTKRCTA